MGTRAGPLAALAAGSVVLLVSCASTAPSPGGASGQVAVTGTVLTAPTCPVIQSGSPCPPRPVPGAVINVYAHSDQVARTSADRAGHFAVHLRPGSYRIQARMPTGLRSTASRDITVGSAPVHLTLTLDSGIR